MARKPKRKSAEMMACTLRVNRADMERLGDVAAGLGFSRNQLIQRLVRVAGEGAEAVESGLFKETESLIEEAVQRGISQALRDGGMDLALRRAAEMTKAAKSKRGKR